MNLSMKESDKIIGFGNSSGKINFLLCLKRERHMNFQ